MFTKGSLIALATILAALVFPGEGRASVTEDLNCLALNIYFEARSEPLDGKLAVGHVVLNRAADKRYPNKICEVVKQGGEKRRNKCQFSWWCDGRSDRPRDLQAWKESQGYRTGRFLGLFRGSHGRRAVVSRRLCKADLAPQTGARSVDRASPVLSAGRQPGGERRSQERGRKRSFRTADDRLFSGLVNTPHIIS